MKPILFIADLHLQDNEPENTRSLLNFLAKQAPQAQALYILGDLFAAWVGDDDNSLYNQEIKIALKLLSSKIPVYFLPGNRDFLLNDKFCAETGCIKLDDPVVIDLCGKPTLLTHGDLLSCNTWYVMFRKCIRAAWVVKIFSTLPLKLRKKIAWYMRKYSSNCRLKQKNYVVSLNKTKQLLQQYKVELIIHGHLHIQGFYDNRISLGCLDQGKMSVLVWECGQSPHFEVKLYSNH
jgi:UDP-2,3-diacylglucosamine hydrolase